MNLQGRNLTVGLTGADVADLHSELGHLGYTIPATEQQASSFGQGTLAAVQRFQTAQGLQATGVVDAATAAAISDLTLAYTYKVTGTVFSASQAGIGNLAVQLVDKNVGSDFNLANTTTNGRGAYGFSLVVTPASLRSRNKTQPDLQVRVSSGTTFLAASAIAYNAPLLVTLNVTLPASAAGLPSEYETLVANLSAAYSGRLGVLQENDQRQDITFIANKTGWDARAVAMVALADQFSQITGPGSAGPVPAPPPASPAPTPQPSRPAVVTETGTSPTNLVQKTAAALQASSAAARGIAAAETHIPITTVVQPPPASPIPPSPPPVPAPPSPAPGIKPEFYYALFRAGLPANTDTLFQSGPSTVEGVWKQAIAQGVIPAALASEVPSALQTFQTLSAAHTLTVTPPIGPSTLSQMLEAGLPTVTQPQQQQFAQLYAQFGSDPTKFWTQVQTALGAAPAQQLKLAGQLFYLTLNNAPLVTALAAAEKQAPIASTLDLATRGYHDTAKWVPLIGSSIPAQIPGANADEQRANYAQLLASQVRIAFPTAVVADLVQKGALPLSSTTTKPTDVAAFLTTNQGKFEIGIEPVEAYLARSKLAGTPAPVVAEIKRVQRVYQLTPDDQSMAVLMQHKIDSAYAITRYDPNGFTRAFQDKLGGTEMAMQIHTRAKQVYGAVLNIAASYLIARRTPGLGGTSPVQIPYPAPATNPTYPVIAYPTLESLFGSLDYCECEDCRSILSPAAYLVDLLNSLDIPAPSTGYQNPQAVLLERRPDLQYLPLTCENTNTALPYIDIVNETLEYFVANNLTLAGFQGFDTGTSVSSDELMANPQNVNDAAYTALQGAYFPPPLPFDRSLALLRLHMEKIGVALPSVMTALRASDTVERGTAAYGWRDILMEQLSISREEYRVFTDSTLKLQGLYGYPTLSDTNVLTALQTTSLQNFSRRTGVSYADLISIVGTRFINPNVNLIPQLQQLNTPFSALKALKDGLSTPSVVAAFKAALPAGLDAREYGGSASTDIDAIVKWVTDASNYARIMSIVTISNPNGADQCTASALQFRYSNPDNSANLLSGTDFVKLIRFIRLWQKLGLGIDQIDDILAALYPANDFPNGTDDAANLTLLDTGFAALLPRVGFLMQMMNALTLTPDAVLAQLLACWAPIDTTGTNSLYASMFLSAAVLQQDPAFVDDGYGNYLSKSTEPLLNHASTLCAAFNITGAEFNLITGNSVPGSLNFGPTTGLTLDNISAVFRIGWFAHSLGISVLEFLLLRYCSGLDPFVPLDPASTAPAEPSAIRFVRLVQALANAGIRPVQALYLLWNQDISGNSSPSDTDVTGLAFALRGDFAAVEAQFTLVDDPDGSIAKGLMVLVYGSTATDFFFGLLNNTLVTSVPCEAAQPVLAQPILDASTGRLTYDDLRKQLSFAGVLDSATQAQIDLAITNNGNDPALHAALATLSSANQQAVGPFFATYSELMPLYTAYVQGTGTPQDRRTTLLANFLPALKQKRKQEQALASITAAAGTDPGFAATLLQDATILHAAADSTAAAHSDLTAIEAQGLSVRFFLTNNVALPPNVSIDVAPNLNYSPASGNPLPLGQGSSAIAGIWSGFVGVPQDGFYNISVTADAGATVALQIAGATVAMAATGNVWKNQTPISLTAGSLTQIVLGATSIRNTLAVNWESIGLGWQAIPAQYLYAQTLIDRLRATYIRFLKTTALATALSLAADEIAWLGTGSALRVNTNSHDKLAAGNASFTPASMNNITTGSKLVIDTGAAQETVTVTAATATTFSAVITNPHDGTVAPFAIVNQAFPNAGEGWLNFLPSAGVPDASTSASLRDVLTTLLDFSRIKAALSPNDERLLAVLQNPALTLGDGTSALLALTGWAQDSVNALLQQFFGSTSLASLSAVENLRRVYDAYSLVNTCRITAATLIAATTNAPAAATVGALQSALRALYAESDWLTAVRPINDAMRIQQRDALVAYVLQQLGDGNASAPLTVATSSNTAAGSTTLNLANASSLVVGMSASGANIATGASVAAISGNTVTLSVATLAALPSGTNVAFVLDRSTINTADKLFEYFLIDVETQPPVDTSRIRLALSSVQLFIERVLRNLEPQVLPTDLHLLASQWPWMKRYRVWQANREVFLWPENWLYPELRDDQSPLFQQTMSDLLQSDITDDAAASAYLEYLTGLEAVAKLEPCGLYYVPASENSDEASYVVARTAGAHRKYFFRQLQYGAWSPWTEVKIDCEDMPLTPIVWNGRLFLFWLKILKQVSPQPAPSGTPVSSDGKTKSSDNINNMSLDNLQSFGQANASTQTANNVAVQAAVCWSEFYNGKWQPTKTSEINRPTSLGTFPMTGSQSFDVNRNLLQIEPAQLAGSAPSIPTDALILAIGSPLYSSWPSGGFVLYNTHSLPVRFEDISSTINLGDFGTFTLSLSFFVSSPGRGRTLSPILSYTGGNTSATFHISYWTNANGTKTTAHENDVIGFNWVPRYVEPQLGLSGAWDAPFFFEDRQHVFYVKTSEQYKTIWDFAGFGMLSAIPRLTQSVPSLPPLVFQRQPPLEDKIGPILGNSLAGGINPAAVQGYLSHTTNIHTAVGSTISISYQGRQINPGGSTVDLLKARST